MPCKIALITRLTLLYDPFQAYSLVRWACCVENPLDLRLNLSRFHALVPHINTRFELIKNPFEVISIVAANFPGFALRAINLDNPVRNVSDSSECSILMSTAQVQRHVNMQPYRFFVVRRSSSFGQKRPKKIYSNIREGKVVIFCSSSS